MYTLNAVYKMIVIGGGERCSSNKVPCYKGQNSLIFLQKAVAWFK